jgi:hypothetical protein
MSHPSSEFKAHRAQTVVNRVRRCAAVTAVFVNHELFAWFSVVVFIVAIIEGVMQ